MKPNKQRSPGPPFLSQAGEDRICHRLFKKIGVRSRCAVEFGAVDGLYKSNTAYFRDVLGWRVVMFDSQPREGAHEVHRALITPENVNDLFRQHDVPDDVDLVSIDIDGNDLWVWKALTFQPQVVIVEFNPRWSPRRSRTVPYDPTRNGWDHTDYYGASAGALVRLGKEKGYTLFASTRSNLIFVREGLVPEMHIRRVKRVAQHSKRRDPQERKWEIYK